MAGRPRIYKNSAEKSRARRERAAAQIAPDKEDAASWRSLVASALEKDLIDLDDSPKEIEKRLIFFSRLGLVVARAAKSVRIDEI